MNDALLVVVVVVALASTSRTASTTRRTRRHLGGDPCAVAAHGRRVSAVANLAGAFVTTAVAKTVASGNHRHLPRDATTVLAALLGAIVWNLLTWWHGLPSSSTHALIGGLVGAALVQSGTAGVQWHGLVHKLIFPAHHSPIIGLLGAFVVLLALYRAFFRVSPGLANRGFRLGQLGSGTWVAFTHGANDAQKTMGVITLALVAERPPRELRPYPRLGDRLLRPHDRGGHVRGRLADHADARPARLQHGSAHGFAAQVARRHDALPRHALGFPVSTTHVVSGSSSGAGATSASPRCSGASWATSSFAWLLTLPAAAIVSAR